MKRLTLLAIPCLLVAFIAILALFPLYMGKASAAAVTAASCGSWKVVPVPHTGSNQFHGVTAISSSDVWAVGEQENLRTSKTLAEHWNGTAWSVVSTPLIKNGSSAFYGVAAASTSDVWAVGIANTNRAAGSLIEHWNGTAWSIVNVPGNNRIGALTGVAVISANDVWAAGYIGGKATWQTLIDHWNGTAWSIVKSPDVKGVNNFLNGVTAVASNDVWAVGNAWTSGVNSSTSATLTEHWNGTAWSIIKSPNPASLQAGFMGVTAISSNDVWAVGNAYVPGANQAQTLTEHWNGSKWSIVKSPNPPSNANTLLGVVALATNNVWAVGYGFTSSGNVITQIIIEHWNGSKWSIVKSPNPSSTNDNLQGVTTVPQTQDLWAVGAAYDSKGSPHSMTEFYC